MNHHHHLILIVLITGLALVGCQEKSPQVSTEPVAPPTETRPQELLPRATSSDGTVFTLEIASTQEEIARGMMFRPSFPEDRAMLFLFGSERMPSFWMKNTLIALDIVFLSRNGTVVDIVKNAQPCKKDPCPQFSPKAPTTAVLEFVAGTADRVGLMEGDRVTFENVPDYPIPGLS